MSDWIPEKEVPFFNLANQFVPPIVANPADFGLVTADGLALHDALYAYTTKRALRIAADAVAAQALTEQNMAEAALKVLMRADGAEIQARPATTDAQRTLLGLPIHKTTHTPVGAPTVAPVLAIAAGHALETVWEWHSEATPKSKARPAGVRATELRMQVGGTPPTDPLAMTNVRVVNNSPDTVQHAPAEGGAVVYGIARYISTLGEPGPWGNITTGTVPHI